MIQSLIAGLLSGIANIIMGIFAAKQAKENEFKVVENVAREASLKIGKEAELQIQNAQSDVVKIQTASQLKLAMGIASMLMLLLVLPGCVAAKVTATTEGYKPLIKTKKPPLDLFNGPEELTPREQLMATYMTTLRAAIGAYNLYAEQRNDANSYPKFDEPKDSGYEIIITPPKLPDKPLPQEVKLPGKAPVVLDPSP